MRERERHSKRRQRGKGLVTEEDRADYILPLRTTKSDISEPRSRSSAKQGPPERKWGRSEKSLGQCSSPSFLALYNIEIRETSESSVVAEQGAVCPSFRKSCRRKKEKSNFFRLISVGIKGFDIIAIDANITRQRRSATAL